jgi:hypothetical protein
VMLLRIAPVSRFFVFTSADGTGAPEGSVTVPLMLAETCERAEGRPNNIRRRLSKVRRRHAHVDQPALQ